MAAQWPVRRFLPPIVLILTALITVGCTQSKQSLTASDARRTDAPAPQGAARVTQGRDTSTAPEGAETTTTLTLYFSDSKGEALVKEVRVVPLTKTPARDAVEALIAGPIADAEPTIAGQTRLLEIEIAKGMATVDFSAEFIDNHPGGSAAERLTVDSIVATLTEFGSVSEVRIKVGGEDVETIKGHIDISEPLRRNDDVLPPD